MLMAAVFAVFAVTSCNEKTEEPEVPAPTIEWPSNPDFDTVELTMDVDVNLTVSAPAGIKSFIVSVESDSDMFMGILVQMTQDHSSNMDLINDAGLISALDELTQGALPTGDSLKDKTEVNFNLSNLVSMLALFSQPGNVHSFTLNLEDNAGNTLTKTCSFETVAQ